MGLTVCSSQSAQGEKNDRHDEPDPIRLSAACAAIEGIGAFVSSLNANTAHRVNAAKLEAELAKPLL